MRDLNLKNESQRLLGRICVTLRAAARTADGVAAPIAVLWTEMEAQGGRDQPRKGYGLTGSNCVRPVRLGLDCVYWLALEMPLDRSAIAKAAFDRPS